VSGKTLRPPSPLYKTRDLVERIEVTPGVQTCASTHRRYTQVQPLSEASDRIRADVTRGVRSCLAVIQVRAGTEKLAADGKNGLAHHTEFKRPDGTWVAVRDNLLNPTHYYAVGKAQQSDFYPPGCAPTCSAALCDGRRAAGWAPWIICNNQSRHDMYLTLTKTATSSIRPGC